MSRNQCILLTLGVYVLICCTPSKSERCSVSVSNMASMSVKTEKSSQQKYKINCGTWGWGRCTRYRTVYSTAYTIQYRQIYETRYKNCQECSDWKFTDNLCQTCGNCQPCKCIQANSVSCNKRDGSCICDDGWHGENCDNKCTQGMYGDNCMQECQCDMNNTVSCDHHDGTCRCKPGWIGSTCNQTCERWHFGDDCSKSCLCDKENTLFCSHDDGICHCKPGWEGTECNETCPFGMYGDKCQENCMCMEDKTTHCDQFNGTCYCREGWEGKYCDTAIKTGDASQSRGVSSKTGAIAGITIVVILIIAVVIVIVLFIILRRGKENGKQGFMGLILNRRTTTAVESTEDGDTITYANVASSINGGENSTQGENKQNVYAVPKGRTGKETRSERPPGNYERGYAEIGLDTINDRSSQEGAGYEVQSHQPVALTYSDVDRTGKAYRPKLANEGSEYDKLAEVDSSGTSTNVDLGYSLVQNPNADISYDNVDRTGRAYIQDRGKVNHYNNLESNTESGMVSGYSVVGNSEKTNEYSGIDRTGKSYRPDTETNYDKLKMN
ncbi:multiple epidermal growth factor-like domains protein 10 isoform X4 [Ptychodera flava]|uniref:multiple epidermal growth factor-like domains protein 10 isoform X4 n=1 Tax=Ptychodera flava TaxID=63121 RepID=UPI003969DE3C